MPTKVDVLFVLFLDCPQDKCIELCIKRGRDGSGRFDDNFESLKKRFGIYRNETVAIIDHFRSLGKVIQIDTNRCVDTVFSDLNAIMLKAQSQNLF